MLRVIQVMTEFAEGLALGPGAEAVATVRVTEAAARASLCVCMCVMCVCALCVLDNVREHNTWKLLRQLWPSAHARVQVPRLASHVLWGCVCCGVCVLWVRAS